MLYDSTPKRKWNVFESLKSSQMTKSKNSKNINMVLDFGLKKYLAVNS